MHAPVLGRLRGELTLTLPIPYPVIMTEASPVPQTLQARVLGLRWLLGMRLLLAGR